MKTVNISLYSDNSMDKVKEFVKIVSSYPFDMDLISGRYVIDAKSILGIFSLDLSSPIELSIHSNDEESISSLLSEISVFLAE